MKKHSLTNDFLINEILDYLIKYKNDYKASYQ